MMRIIPSLFILLLTPLFATAQETELPEEARYRLDYLIGTWDVYDERLDENGNVIETTHSIHINEYWLGDSVIQTTSIPDEGDIRKTIRFYDKELETFYEIGVGKEGDVWILSGGLDEYYMQFKARQPREDGSYAYGRFFHTEIEPNSYRAIFEVSTDNGETWERRTNSNQRLVRRTTAE